MRGSFCRSRLLFWSLCGVFGLAVIGCKQVEDGVGVGGPSDRNGADTDLTPSGTDSDDRSSESDSQGTDSATETETGSSPSLPGWRLIHHETFDAPFDEPAGWTEDTYGPGSPYHVGPFDEDGEFFVDRGGQDFLDGLAAFRSYRKSYTYGADDWLTVELYGRDGDLDGTPETGGEFVSDGGAAQLISTRHYDGAIIRPTEALPEEYRVEVTVSDINFGGKREGSWYYDSKVNGYSAGDESGDPWRFTDGSTTPLDAYRENGLYFLCITDYAEPAPHNNVFIHHHRKVVMDSDNNMDEWSRVYNPETDLGETDGSHYVSMLWMNGEDFGDDWTGNSFISYVPRETGYFEYDVVMADKYKEGEAYVFAIERRDGAYTLEVTGDFHHLGFGTLRMSKSFREVPVVWHYNQNAAEYDIADRNQVKNIYGVDYDTWPQGSAYPDYFLFGDPHINYYEGTARYDDLKFYLPE